MRDPVILTVATSSIGWPLGWSFGFLQVYMHWFQLGLTSKTAKSNHTSKPQPCPTHPSPSNPPLLPPPNPPLLRLQSPLLRSPSARVPPPRPRHGGRVRSTRCQAAEPANRGLRSKPKEVEPALGGTVVGKLRDFHQ